MKSDLHLHSNFSDGSSSVEGGIALAKANGLEAISFVDHDTVETYDYIKANNLAEGIHIIPGIEISAYDFQRNTKVHVLGYNYKSNPVFIPQICDELVARRHNRSLEQLALLLDAGYDIDVSKLEMSQTKEPVLYKQHLMKALTDAPYTSVLYQELYKSLFKGDGICSGDIEYVDVHLAVKAIKSDGGIAVIAHPGQFNNYELIPELIKCGLDGIELNHPDHTEKDHQLVKELAAKYNLIMTGGSDYHGDFWIEVEPGDCLSSEDFPKTHHLAP